MTKIIDLARIREILQGIGIHDLLSAIEDGFVMYSAGRVVVPQVGHLAIPRYHGDVHIKYGYIVDDEYYVIKIASSFYDNPSIGLPSSDGLMLIFSQRTGNLLSILLDEGYLTDVRTALAGAVVAKYLGPKRVISIGIVGSGTQARLQLEYLRYISDCRQVIVWGRSTESLNRYALDMEKLGFKVSCTRRIEDLTSRCNLIVTVTPSEVPLITRDLVQPGTHLTAVGADTRCKNELDPFIFQAADLVVSDSRIQCIDHGELYHAVSRNLIKQEKIMELGELIRSGRGRFNESEITVADLTGVAIQDVQICKQVLVHSEYSKGS